MAITLGKDCTISVSGLVASARNVTLTQTARTIDIEEFGSRFNSVYSTGFDASVSIEFNDSSDLGSIFSVMQNGTSVTVSGGAGAWSFPAVVVGISETDPIDGVATFTVECRITKEGLKV